MLQSCFKEKTYMASYLKERIENAKKTKKMAVIPFITAEFPNKEKFWNVLDTLDAAGADIVEIGVPFSDPVADGPVVEAASLKALAAGVTLSKILQELKSRAGTYKMGIVLMGYYNCFFQYGLEAFAKDAQEAGVHGCIIPDLPYEEALEFRNALAKYNLDLVSLVGINTNEERMKKYAEVSTGYVYLVSNLGVTGGRVTLPQEALDALSLAKKAFPLPIALGFGLKEPEQLSGLPEMPDAAVIGSAFLQLVESGGDVTAFIKKWS